MSQIDASAFRRDLFSILDRLPHDGSVEIVRHGKVVARLVSPKGSSTKPQINPRRLARLCQKHHIQKLALFGSILRDDFGPESDVDVLVDPVPGYLQTIEEYDAALTALTALFGRTVDLVERETLQRNPSPTFTKEILATAQVIYGG
jgi:uncharacterized protein